MSRTQHKKLRPISMVQVLVLPESGEMRETLAKQSVDLLQGYAISLPAKAAKAAAWLRTPDGLLDVN